MRWSPIIAALLLLPSTAGGHGGEPSVTGLRFPSQRPGEVWAITDNQGLYAARGDTTAWLCEDAVAPAAGIDDIVALGDGQRWLILTDDGVFTSDDGGCTFGGAPVALADQQVAALSGHPLDPAEAVAVTETFAAENDVWLTADGGGTWRAVGLGLRGRFTGLLRSEADPERLYALHDRGAYTSGDGGRRWQPIALGPPELAALPSAVTLLAAPPGAPERIYLGIERPAGLVVVRSDDAGRTWREAVRVDDFEAQLVFDGDGREGLLLTAFDGLRRTADGGATWGDAAPLPVERLQRIGRAPDGRLWGSTGLFFGGPFALGVSDDFGRTWAPVLVRFEDVDARWDCPPPSPARTCCETLCPGQPIDAMCVGQVPDEGGACASALDPPPGPLPGFEVDGGVDAAPLDGGPADDGVDRGSDAAALDASAVDATASDVTEPDALPDGARRDRGPSVDSEPTDAGMLDGRVPDRGSPDTGAAGLDSTVPYPPPPDGEPPIYAPDVTVIPAHPASDGCAQRPGSAPPWWLALLVLSARCRPWRLRPRRRPRRGSAR